MVDWEYDLNQRVLLSTYIAAQKEPQALVELFKNYSTQHSILG